jgi:Ni,Fe-hydrogenase III large subunit
LLELERLYNHLGDSGNICAGVGFSVGAMAGAQLKEELQRLNERLVGHRFLRGACAPGGLRRDLSIDGLSSARGVLADLRERSLRFGDMVLATESLIERARTTGVLKPEWIRDLGGVGVAARASGVDTDLRRDRPTETYRDLAAAGTFRVPTQASGDAEARLRQRLDEAEVSFAIVDRLFANVTGGAIRAPLGDLRVGEVGIGAAESPRGANVHAVMLAEDGTVDRLRIRSASFPNWPLVPLTVPGNLVPDFPLINKSFELCYACLDR